MTSLTQQAIEAVKAGMTQTEAAKIYGITRQAVSAGLKYTPSGQPRGRCKKTVDEQGRLQCSKCGELKPAEDFGRGSCSNGKASHCKACVSAYAKSRLPTRKSLEDRITALEERQEYILERLNNLSLKHTSSGDG